METEYKKSIKRDLGQLANFDNAVFLGQGITVGDRIYGTMVDVPLNKCIEMPVDEELMMGMAIGMSLEGYLPIVLFQRMDFILKAVDQIVNHLDTISIMSNRQFNPHVIIRTIVGSNDSKFDVGLQHKMDYYYMFIALGLENIQVSYYVNGNNDYKFCDCSSCSGKSLIIIEEKDKYEAV